ncbi:cytochrome P450 [Dictyobacter kobayashii]|uniref:Putative cytochrome P450 YjiB n=1 Tax=Dictyobacter kobayashii TaxID=2014872 RepID=A0A402AD86_9CHLR|nr:cytochrome P450 [Dictyobacter kobayashii]GCE17067.1 putative cytochrome P450 YjiB [Dictyobacter kobayashii]
MSEIPYKAFAHIPLAMFRQMRQNDPVHFEPRMRGWAVFRYADAMYVLSHPQLFSSEAILPGQPHLPSILGMDEPRHRKLRNIVSQVFTPRMIEQLTPQITAVVQQLLDKVIPRGRMDVIQDFAYPLPIIIIAGLLGVPAEDQAIFRSWSDSLTAANGSNDTPETRVSNAQSFQAYFLQKLAERRSQPQQDLMSRLLSAEVDGEKLSDEELLEFCRLLLIAGYETTANLLGNAFVCFDQYPEVVEELRQHPEFMPGAVEEILRCFPSVAGDNRVALEDLMLGDKQIQKHQTVSVMAISANYDEEQFPEPERFDIHRDPNRHITFGYGIHFCLGAPLARLEAKIALNIVLQRIQNIQRDPTRPVEPVQSPFIVGVRSFPITFTATA